MKEQTSLVPKRRFKDFSNTLDWEQRRLGEIAEKVSVGIATSSSGYFTDSKKGVPFIKNQNIKQNRIDDSELEFISEDFDQANSTKRVKTGDILTVRTGYPGLSAVVPAHLNGAQTFTTLITRLKVDKTLPEFVSTFINSEAGMRQIIGMEAGGAQKNVNAGILKNLSISIPSFDEQKMVKLFFRRIENLITLHQRKLEKTKALKSAYLSEMFPAEGEHVPKRRFAGFTDAWEQRRLGDVTNSYSGGTPSVGNYEYYDGDIPFIRSAEINSDSTELFISESGLKNSSAKVVEVGDILYALYGATSGEVGISRINGAINQAILAIQPDEGYDSQFIMQWLRNQKQKIIDKYLQGGQGNLSGSIVNNFQIRFPSYDEQAKIGGFFRELNHLITLHQRKLEKLQNLKKAYLNEMFV